MAGAVERLAGQLRLERERMADGLFGRPIFLMLEDVEEILTACGAMEPDCTGLPDRQAEVLRFIHQFQRDNGFPPPVRGIGRAIGVSSTATVAGHLRALEAKGRIRWHPEYRQGLQIVR